MDCILNELSLSGQYSDISDFANRGVKPLSEVLKEMKRMSINNLYKKGDFYNSLVLQDLTFNDALFCKESKTNDLMRRMKGQLAALQNEPYWDIAPLQDAGKTYLMKLANDNQRDVSRTSIAEAQARNAVLVSFVPSDYDRTPICVTIQGENGDYDVHNIWDAGQLAGIMFENGIIDIATYFKEKYHKRFDFGRISKTNGFNLISTENIHLFISTFRIFEQLSWQEIFVSDALDYKVFSKNRNTKDFFAPDLWSKGIYKFRVSQEIRCFGYKEGETFFLLRIDLDHILSDQG